MVASGSDHLTDVDAEVAYRTVRDDDEQRRDRAPRPACEVVQVERCPRGESHELRWHARHAVPRVDAEQREPDLGEHARFDQPALVEDHAQRLAEPGLRGVDTQDAQRHIGLDRRAQIAGSVVVERPGSVLTLRTEYVADRSVANIVVRHTEKAEQEHVLGRHGHVGFQLAAPPTRGILVVEEPVDCGTQRFRWHWPSPAPHRRRARPPWIASRRRC